MSVDRIEVVRGRGRDGGRTTAAAARRSLLPVAPGVPPQRPQRPRHRYSIVRVLPEGAHVPICCQSPGNGRGPYGTTNIWDNIDNGEYVSDAYVQTGSDGYVASRCS